MLRLKYPESLRVQTCETVIDLFRSEPQVKRVYLRGSLAEGNADGYSDIDIGVDVSGFSNAEYARRVIELMGENFDIHFYDFAKSLMPYLYVMTFYLKGWDIFWNVDIECVAEPHCATLLPGEIEQDISAHQLKLWAITAKYYLRGARCASQKIHSLASKVQPSLLEEKHSLFEIMRCMLNHIGENCDDKYSVFLDSCRAELSRIG